MPGPIAWKKSLWSHLHNLDCEPDREACLILSSAHHPGFSQDQERNLRSGWAERHKPFSFHPPSADSKRTEPKLGRKGKNAFFANQLRCNGFFQKEWMDQVSIISIFSRIAGPDKFLLLFPVKRFTSKSSMPAFPPWYHGSGRTRVSNPGSGKGSTVDVPMPCHDP